MKMEKELKFKEFSTIHQLLYQDFTIPMLVHLTKDSYWMLLVLVMYHQQYHLY